MTQPRLLILETSGKVGEVALAQGDQLLSVRRLDEARRHARDLVPTVAELLAQQGWKARELNGVVVSKGPGSYTGLRVGIMSAKALAYATDCALIAVDTFAAIASQAPVEIDALEVIADAQQDKIYVQRWVKSRTVSRWQEGSPLAILRLEEWLTQQHEDVPVTGPGLHAYGALLSNQVSCLPVENWDPRAQSVGKIGWARYLGGNRDDVWALEPHYLRPSSAEEKWQNRP